MSPYPKLYFGWRPRRWEDFIGNQKAVKLLKGFTRRVSGLVEKGTEIEQLHAILLVQGPSRSGKTALIKHFMRCLVCDEIDPVTLNPCDRSCPVCRLDPASGFHGLFLAISKRLERSPVNLESIDCAWERPSCDFKKRLLDARDRPGLNVMFLDEMHRLVKGSLDEILLKHTEETPALWILVTAKTADIEDMLKNRALIVETEPPNTADLVAWLKSRCCEAGLKADDSAIDRLAAKVNRNPGHALKALSEAASYQPEDGLTLDFVEEWKLPIDH